MDSASAPGTFELGLTMAGAVSGGAYTAGVLDFLVEALDQWQLAKDKEADLPPAQRSVPCHQVLLTAVSGASAGAMCSAIMGAALGTSFAPARWDGQADQDGTDGSANPLFAAWVQQIRIEDMLTTTDDAPGPLPSLLNSTPIDRILDQVLSVRGATVRRPWLADPLTLRFAVTNLRGVSYNVGMRGNTDAGHEMRNHADHLDFRIRVDGGTPWTSQLPELAAAVELRWPPSPQDSGWRQYGMAAVASGALPFALKARRLERHPSDYWQREWADVCRGPATTAFIQPSAMPASYGFYALDGGLTNNEPFELARQVISGSPWDSRPRDGLKADSAVIMIDPFVEDVDMQPDDAGREQVGPVPSLFELVMPLVNAWILQCRFKPAEMALANREDVYSRFIIAPSRGDAGFGPLAAGGLGTFLGFCHESYRVHDYLLGRRNCQKFLRDHFSLPLDNPVIQAGYCQGGVVLPSLHGHATPGTAGKGPEWPIIPLCGTVQDIEYLPHWPAGMLDPETLRDAVKGRASFVIGRLSGELATASGGAAGWLVRAVSPLLRVFGAGKVADLIIAKMQSELRRTGL